MPQRQKRKLRAQRKAAQALLDAGSVVPGQDILTGGDDTVPEDLADLDMVELQTFVEDLPMSVLYGKLPGVDEPMDLLPMVDDGDRAEAIVSLGCVPFGPIIDIPPLLQELASGNPGSMGLTPNTLEDLTARLSVLRRGDQIRGMVFYDDLSCLDEGRWLSNIVIDEYFKLLCSESYQWSRIRGFSVMSMRLIGMLKKSGADPYYTYPQGRRESADFLKSNFILFPVCLLNNHWALITADLVSHEVKGYDPLSHTGAYTEALNTAIAHFKEFINFNRFRLTGQQFRPAAFPTIVPARCPSQVDNRDDCGVHVCMLAKFLLLKDNLTFTQADMPAARKIIKYELIKGKILGF